MVLTWDVLIRFNIHSPPTYTLGRSKQVQEKYDRHREWMKSEKVDVKSYINGKFDLETNQIVFTENEFPYNCEEGIRHYIIWISDKYKYNTASLNEYIKTKIKSNTSYVFYKNIPANNSITSVDHYHVFVKIGI